jgi:eukaryotic-like serine/threonine-protein kinase
VRSTAIHVPATITIEGAPASADRAFGTNWAETTRYALVSELARGGGGRITIAIDRKLGRRVALKRAIEHGGDPRLEREALVLAKLEHPAIVPIHDVGHDTTGAPYYTMKLVGGHTLAAKLEAAQRFEDRLGLLSTVTTVADAMAYAHSQGVIHRDLKPANIVVGEFGEVAVIDWGLGKLLGEVDAAGSAEIPLDRDLTAHGAVLGTPAYMAPEQALAKTLDERADVYAIGAILYHVLSGEVPYGRLDSSATLTRLIDGPPPPIDHREPRVPRDLAAIVAKATAREPRDRYRDARELAEDLHRYQTGRLVAAHRYSMWARGWRWMRRHATVLAGAAAIVALGIAAALALRSGLLDEDRAEAEREAHEKSDALAKKELERAKAVEEVGASEAAKLHAQREVELKRVESREELAAKNARLERALAGETAAREHADRATRAAQQAADDARRANAQLQEALDRERARVKLLEEQKKHITTTLE